VDVEQPYAEVLGEDGKEPLVDRLWQDLLRRPLALPLLAIFALVLVGAGALVLTGRGPEVAQVTIIPANSSTTATAPWQAAASGRPAGMVVLSVAATVRRGKSGAPTSVVGMTGPAVVDADNPAVLVPAGRTVTVPLRAEVDCRLLPEVIAPGAYGLRTRARSGWGSKDGRTAAGAEPERWSTAIQLACASWFARRDLTVTALTAHVHPAVSKVDLKLTVSNSGSRVGTLTRVVPEGLSVHVLGAPITVPAHAQVTAERTVVLDTCDSVTAGTNETSPLSVDPGLTTGLNLVALAGAVPAAGPMAPPETEGAGQGFGPTGVLLGADADRNLAAALNQACAGLDPMVPLIAPGTVRYDRTSQLLTVPVLIDVTPGRVRKLRLETEPFVGAGAGYEYRPLQDSLDGLVPDRTGQVRATLYYRAPALGACPTRGGFLPSVLAILDVRAPDGDRTVKYQGTFDLSQDPKAIPLLCRSK
jgi:hypothetical protein